MQIQRIASMIYTLDNETDILTNIKLVPEPDNMESLGCFGTHDKPSIVCTHLYVDKGLATDISCKGELILQGGKIDRVQVEQGGSLLALQGTALNVEELGGDVDTGAFQGEITFVPMKWSATKLETPASVHKGNVCYNTTIFRYGTLFVYDGGHAHDLELYGGDLEILEGGDVFNVILHEHGDCTVENDGCIRNVTVEQDACLRLKSGAKALDVTIKKGGRLIEEKGAITDRITMENGGRWDRKQSNAKTDY